MFTGLFFSFTHP